MNTRRYELGILADDTKIESKNLRGLKGRQLTRYARELTNLAKQMEANNELTPGNTPLGFARDKWTREHMAKIAKQGSAMCNLIFINDELLGITYFESRDAGEAPIPIARPQRFNMKIEYHLASPYRDDAEANRVVASSLIPTEPYPDWRWDIISPEEERMKTETYAKLGMVALTDGSVPIYGNGSWSFGQPGQLWAKQPAHDDPTLATLMEDVNAAVHRIQAEKNRD